MKTMTSIIIAATILVILFIAFDSRGEPYYPPHTHTEKYEPDSICVPVDSIWRLNDWLSIERNTVRVYEKMTRRLLFECDSLRMLFKRER